MRMQTITERSRARRSSLRILEGDDLVRLLDELVAENLRAGQRAS